VILAFHGDTLLATFTEGGFSGDLGDNSNVFLGVQDSTGSITEIVYLIVNSDPSTLQNVAINQLSVVPASKAQEISPAVPHVRLGGPPPSLAASLDDAKAAFGAAGRAQR